MKIGIYGGSFNPPHIMHKSIVEELIKKEYVDKIIIVPTGVKYHYKNNLLGNEIRYKLLEQMTKDKQNIKISTYEFQEKEVFTYETMAYYKDKYTNDELFFICGSDNLTDLKKWEQWEKVLECCKILVIPRNGQDVKEIKKEYAKYNDRIIIADIETSNISSTIVRKAIKEKDMTLLEKYVDKDVLDYIVKNHLYQN